MIRETAFGMVECQLAKGLFLVNNNGLFTLVSNDECKELNEEEVGAIMKAYHLGMYAEEYLAAHLQGV